MAVLRDKEEEKGQGTSQALGQPVSGQMQPQEQAAPQQTQPSAPATIGGSSATQPSTSVKAMPKQQKAGTGTFSNLKSYLQAAQGGGQQKVAQAATQQVQRLGAGAQKGVQQAQESFGRQMQAGSLKGMETAAEEAKGIVGTARGTTYQAPEQIAAQNQERAGLEDGVKRVGINPPDFDFWKDKIRQPDGRITYKDGTPFTPGNLDKLSEMSEVATPALTTAPAQPQQYFTPEQQQRFADIINAQYQGPASLQQAGLYEQAAKKARAAQQTGELTQTAGGREQLLRDVFGRGRDYSRGASRLDALLLNASEQGVQQLQQQAQPALQSQQALQAAQNLSTNEAAQRAAAIEGIRSGARQQFTEARTEEEEAAQDYITNIQNNWDKLPEYFKNILTESATPTTSRVGDISRVGGSTKAWNAYYDKYLAPGTKGTTYNLSGEEAQILGLTPGQGLFGVSPDVIQAAPKALGEELITKNQLSRQLALQQLANLDKTSDLKKTLQYTDLEKAGTKNLLSSLDTTKLQAIQEENRRDMEEAVSRMGSVSLGANQKGYQPYAFSDILKAGGYTPLDTQGLVPEDRALDTLRNVAEGGAYVPAEQTPTVENYIQRIFEGPQYSSGFNTDQVTNWALRPLQREISKYGAFDTVQQVENEQTAARAQALRDLLAGIYKK
jgi:hypothetical protein